METDANEKDLAWAREILANPPQRLDLGEWLRSEIERMKRGERHWLDISIERARKDDYPCPYSTCPKEGDA